MLLLFKGLYEGFGKFGKFISSLINFVLLFVVFIVGIGLVSVIAKIAGKKFLDMGKSKKKSTYWENSIIGERNREDFYRPF